MTKKCNPQPFEVKRCPDCTRVMPEPPTNGKKKCSKCLQFVIFEGGIAKHCVPKELIY